MIEPDETNDAAMQTEVGEEGGVGNLEIAGETTAAETLGGPPDARPVGVDTMAKVKISGEST